MRVELLRGAARGHTGRPSPVPRLTPHASSSTLLQSASRPRLVDSVLGLSNAVRSAQWLCTSAPCAAVRSECATTPRFAPRPYCPGRAFPFPRRAPVPLCHVFEATPSTIQTVPAPCSHASMPVPCSASLCSIGGLLPIAFCFACCWEHTEHRAKGPGPRQPPTRSKQAAACIWQRQRRLLRPSGP